MVSQGEIIPRVVFLLTDGQFTDQIKILDLIDAHAHQSSVYTIGIGSDVVEQDLINIALHGKGQSLIVKHIHSSSLQSRIIGLLQRKSLIFAKISRSNLLSIFAKISTDNSRQYHKSLRFIDTFV